MENLILEWQKRQQKYEELAEKYKDDAHNNRKFTYKAMETRDCWKELALQLQQTGVSGSNWFQKLPLHWRYIYYMIGGIVIGLLLHYVW